MPLTSAIQSAMAIRHEREKRHQRRLSKIRRESGVCCKKIWSTLVQIVFAGGKILPVLAGGKSSGKCGGLTQTERLKSWRCVDARRGPFLFSNYDKLHSDTLRSYLLTILTEFTIIMSFCVCF